MAYTIADIAKITGVSKATRVINNKTQGVSLETRRRILNAIEDLGYRPNVHARSVAGMGAR